MQGAKQPRGEEMLGAECYMAHPDHRPRPKTKEEREQEALQRLESPRVRDSVNVLLVIAFGVPIAIGFWQYFRDPLRALLLQVVLHFF